MCEHQWLKCSQTECLKTGVAVHIPLISLCLSFLGKKNPQGSKKNVQAFLQDTCDCSILWTDQNQEGRGEETRMEGKKVLDGLFFGNEVKISGSQGEKSAQPSQKNGKKKKKQNPRQSGWWWRGPTGAPGTGWSSAIRTRTARTWLCSFLSLSGF